MRPIIAVLLLSLLAACASSREDYVPPTGAAVETAATIIGSRIHKESSLESDPRAYLVSIDNRLTLGGPSSWDEPVSVLAGQRNIEVGVSLGGLGTNFGFAYLRATLEPQKHYKIVTTDPVDLLATVWIEDDAGNRVSPKAYAKIGMAEPTFIYIPAP